MTATPDQIVAYARTWIGSPWRHQGRNRSGVDCAGLLAAVCAEFDLPYTDKTGYRRDPGIAFQQHIEKFSLPADGPIHGGIAILSDSNQPCHTGIFAMDKGHLTLIHAEASPKRRVHEEAFFGRVPALFPRLISTRLFIGVDYGI